MGYFRFVGGVHSDLSRKPFMVMNYNTCEGGTGHPGFICHKQPHIERHLRDRIKASGSSNLRVSSTLQSIREDDDYVYATYTDAAGASHEVRAQYLVGADGKTGFTRKKYLEPRGVSLDRLPACSYNEVWVALNWRMSLPTPETHPDFPLWKKGFSPQQVYDAFFPTDFRFLCNPSRAAVCGRFGLDEDRLWRFEFVVLPGEDGTVMAGEDKIREIVHPYLIHPASRYGLGSGVITYPEDCIEVLRCRPFSFNARSCNRWWLNRVVLCGDAAHVFPPFGGQGIASGFRDAIALAWRLVLATGHLNDKKNEVDGDRLLSGWCAERKQQLDKSLAATIENGDFVTATNPLKILVRDWYLWVLQLVPSWKRWLEQGQRREGMWKYRWEKDKGMAFLPEMGGGGNFPQVYCTRLGDHAKEEHQKENVEVLFTDDAIFSNKKGVFQLVVLLDNLSELEGVNATVKGITDASDGYLIAGEATFFLNDTKTPNSFSGLAHPGTYRLATAEEFSASPNGIHIRRPPPLHYDAHRMSKEVNGSRFVILRADRFIFAVADSVDEILKAAKAVPLVARGSAP